MPSTILSPASVTSITTWLPITVDDLHMVATVKNNDATLTENYARAQY